MIDRIRLDAKGRELEIFLDEDFKDAVIHYARVERSYLLSKTVRVRKSDGAKMRGLVLKTLTNEKESVRQDSVGQFAYRQRPKGVGWPFLWLAERRRNRKVSAFFS